MENHKIQYISSLMIVGTIGLFVRQLPYSSAMVALSRGAIGCLFVLGYCLMRGKIDWKKIKANLFVLIAAGIALGVNWILLFQSYRYTTLTNATICYYLAPVIIMILSPILFKESLSVKKIACIFAALTGLICISGFGNSGGRDFIGICYGLGAACFYATIVVLNKRLKDISGVDSTFIQLGVAALSLLPYVLLQGEMNFAGTGFKAIIILLIVGVIHTGIVYILYFSSIQSLKGQVVAVLSYIDPLVAIFCSWIFLRESISIYQVIGGILILGSAYIGS